MNRHIRPSELVKAVRKECDFVRFVDARHFTGLSTYGASFHVRESEWNGLVLDVINSLIFGMNYKVDTHYQDCICKDGAVILTVGIHITLRKRIV